MLLEILNITWKSNLGNRLPNTKSWLISVHLVKTLNDALNITAECNLIMGVKTIILVSWYLIHDFFESQLESRSQAFRDGFKWTFSSLLINMNLYYRNQICFHSGIAPNGPQNFYRIIILEFKDDSSL